MNMPKEYELIGECTDSYHARKQEDGSYKIYIEVSKRFAHLVLYRLTELRTNDEEIAKYESKEQLFDEKE